MTPHYIAVDTETHLIADRTSVPQKAARVYTSPYATPRLVLATACAQSGPPCLFSPDEIVAQLGRWLTSPDIHLVFHHAPFDTDVLCAFEPRLWPLFRDALAAGRIHDTKILDILYRLAAGWYDRPQRDLNWGFPELKPRSLDELSQAYLGRAVPKDLVDAAGDPVRLSFHKFDGRLAELPDVYRTYAVEDARTTRDLFLAMLRDAPPDLWGEPAQVRSEVALYALDKRGVRVDAAEAQRLHALFSADLPALQTAVVNAGLAAWLPTKGTQRTTRYDGLRKMATFPDGIEAKDTGWRLWEDGLLRREKIYKKHWTVTEATPAFHLLTNAVRARLADLATELGITPRLTDTGLIAASGDDWKDDVPADRADLQAWLAHDKLRKILDTYLALYSQVDHVYPRWRSIGARSGRMSASCPPIQQVPKHNYGIRSLFLPSPGHVFIKADYCFQELLTLAQAMLDMGIQGPLLAAIRAGEDPHVTTAARMLDLEPADVTKEHRQAAKAVNFGVPGGLGPRKLADYARKTFGVRWTVEEARSMRDRFLAAYPDIATFLERHKTDFGANLHRVTGAPLSHWKAKLGCERVWDLREAMRLSDDPDLRRIYYDAERSLTVRLRTGRIRKGCSFTEGANTQFQGLASDVTKDAVWRAHCEGLRVVLVVHDEIVIEWAEKDALSTARLLEACMLNAFRHVCPDVGPHARVEVSGPLHCWGKATTAAGETA